MMPSTEVNRVLKRSPASRAALAILRTCWRATHTGLSVPQVCYLLRKRHPASTTQHAVCTLRRLGAVVSAGMSRRTRRWGRGEAWRAD